MNVVLDTSVVAKWFLKDEKGALQAEILRRKILEGEVQVFIPELLFLEVCNLLLHKSTLSEGQIHDFLNVLYGMNFTIVPLVTDGLGEWVHICRTNSVTSYDGLYVAIAKLFSCKFITADILLGRKVSRIVDTLVI